MRESGKGEGDKKPREDFVLTGLLMLLETVRKSVLSFALVDKLRLNAAPLLAFVFFAVNLYPPVYPLS